MNKYESMDLTNIPKAISRTAHKMKRPNVKVSLHRGPIMLISKNKTLQQLLVEGTIALHWFPNIHIVIQGNTKELHALEVYKIIHDHDDFDVFIGNKYIGNCFISDYNNIGTNVENTVNIRAIFSTSALVGDPSARVDMVFFHLPNIKRLPGSAVRYGTKLLRNRIQLTHGETEITIDLSPNYEQLHTQLKREGGFLFLAQGRLKSNIGMTHEEVNDMLFCLSRFLTLLNGRRLSPFCRQAFGKEKRVWTEFNNYHVDIFKASPSLVPMHDFIPFNDLWMGFREIWVQDQDFIRTVVHWFVEANNNSVFVEGALVLSQTNLELLFNWLIVEKNNAPSTSDYRTWNAAQKIRMLLSEINLPCGIENSCKHLKAYVHQNQDWQYGDGPEVITRIRNALVHAQKKKRDRLVKIDAMVRNEALQLSLWYVERTLLHILGYHGKYHNRLSKLVEVIK